MSVLESRQAAEFRAGSREVSSRDRALSLGSGPEAVDHSVVLGRIPGGQDVGMGGGQLAVDDNAVFDLQPRLLRQGQIGPNARGDHDQIRRQALAVLQEHAVDVFIAEDLAGHRLGTQRKPDSADVIAEDFSSLLVQLPRQEPPMAFQERHVGPSPGQRSGSLQAE